MCPGGQMGRRWSAKPTVRVPFGKPLRVYNSRPGLQALQCSDLWQSPKLITWYMRVQLSPLLPMHRWCNGSTRVSKTFGQGSNPCLCVLVLLPAPVDERLSRCSFKAEIAGSNPVGGIIWVGSPIGVGNCL